MSSLQENPIVDAIKSKLKDFLDEFSIDNQLIDYIMIMIRNENTQEQITEDLIPFMGDQAAVFSAWLEEKLKSSLVRSSSPRSNGSSEELDIQIDENEFNDDLNPSNQENRRLNQRSFADIKLEKIRSKRRLDEQLNEHNHKSNRNRRNKKIRAGEVRFVNNDANKISSRLKRDEPISKRKVFKIANEAENHIRTKKHTDSSETSDQEMKVDIESEIVAKNRMTRCSFWPLCDKGDECAFLHPNKPCIMFPNCQYGQKCRYIHPVCRYDGFCTRDDCVFMHLTPKNNNLPLEKPVNESEEISVAENLDDVTTEVSNNANSSSIFYGNSNSIQTKNLYPLSNQYNLVINRYNKLPIYCKFDSLCLNPICKYLHTNVFQTNENRMKMKWKATNSLTLKTSMQEDLLEENLTSSNENSNTETQTNVVISA